MTVRDTKLLFLLLTLPEEKSRRKQGTRLWATCEGMVLENAANVRSPNGLQRMHLIGLIHSMQPQLITSLHSPSNSKKTS